MKTTDIRITLTEPAYLELRLALADRLAYLCSRGEPTRQDLEAIRCLREMSDVVQHCRKNQRSLRP